MLIRMFVVLSSLVLFACSGNNSSSKPVEDNTLKHFSGVVNSASVYGVNISVNPIGSHGQFRLNKDNQLDSISLVSNDKGRYGVLLKTEEKGVHIITASAPNADTEAKVSPAKMQCQVVSGCMNADSSAVFGNTYPMPTKSQWSAGVEFISDGQFVVLNPITEMATLLGFSTYVNSPEDTAAAVGSIVKPGHYSSFGVVKGNSQVAALLGLSDIVSIEPVNLFSLNNIESSSSRSLQDSIRYGALLAGWQQLELEFNKQIVGDGFTFQQEVISDFIGNQGQLYQAAPLNNQKLSMKAWYEAAVVNLIAAHDFHRALSRSIPKETNLIISNLQSEIANFKNGELTTAKPKIPEELNAQYVDAIAKTKAMVNYLSDLKNNFADEEFRDNVQSTSTLATDEIRRLSPKFDALMKRLLQIKEYYLSCVHQSECNTASPWHSADNIFVAGTKTLTLVQSGGDKLEVSQAKVYSDAKPKGSKETHAHDLFIRGVVEVDGLRIELSDTEPEKGEPIRSALRFAFSKALVEIPQEPDLIIGGKGARIAESLVPDAINLTLPRFKLYDLSTKTKDKELTLAGAFRVLLVANVSADDFRGGIYARDKLGKRYNISTVDASLSAVGKREGDLAGKLDLRDNIIISIKAVASEAVAGPGNSSAYFPDTIYPTLESFFKPRKGFEIGKKSSHHMVVSRRGVMDFPPLNSKGEIIKGEADVEVAYLELDYEVGGLDRYVVYPKVGQEDKFIGLMCSASVVDEKDLIGRTWKKDEKVDGKTVTRALLTCNVRDMFNGVATPDNLINEIYIKNKDLVGLREYNGQGVYRMDYPTRIKKVLVDKKETNVEVLDPFPQSEASFYGVLDQSIVLGVDSMRLQLQSKFVNNAATGFLPEAVLDISLIWRRHDLIDVNVFLAFNADQKFNNPNGSGLPFLGVGDDVESYSFAYKVREKDASKGYGEGDEVGEFIFAWSGVQFVDGPVSSEKVMKRTNDVNLKESVIAGIGSNVSYRDYTLREKKALGLTDDEISALKDGKCGFFGRGGESESGKKCSAIAYLTFRGLVTGTLREERDGSYVIRYIDGTWQVLGVK